MAHIHHERVGIVATLVVTQSKVGRSSAISRVAAPAPASTLIAVMLRTEAITVVSARGRKVSIRLMAMIRRTVGGLSMKHQTIQRSI